MSVNDCRPMSDIVESVVVGGGVGESSSVLVGGWVTVRMREIESLRDLVIYLVGGGGSATRLHVTSTVETWRVTDPATV